MEFLMDPSIWIGLVTLIVLEIVLGIDNLVFIAILAEKLPPKERDKARILGLTLALVMRLIMLATISWVVTLTKPLFSVWGFGFSGRELIMLLGGLFLLFKATTELHERLEGHISSGSNGKAHAGFWIVVTQIVVLDAVFSLDSVITAIGMVNNLWIMIAAVIIAMGVMLLASKALTNFVNTHPTVVVLCLSFLLMIGLSLVAEGFGFHLPKGYLYAAIGFSILIELFNQIAHRNFVKHEQRRPLRERTAETIMRMMGGRNKQGSDEKIAETDTSEQTFAAEERYMISGVLTLASRTLRTIMTPRNDISWINCHSSSDEIRELLLETPHSLFPICMDSLDDVIGVMRAKDVLIALEDERSFTEIAAESPPVIVAESMDVINLLDVLRHAKGRLVMVSDEFGSIQGVVTPLDVLEAIAGEFPDEDETPDIISEGDGWLVKGGTDLHALEQELDSYNLVNPVANYASLAGLLLSHSEKLPTAGEIIEIDGFRFEVLEIADYRIELVRITRISTDDMKEESED